jgi:hypothetical protein
MALINLQSNLKSLTYGEFGGNITGTKDPLVTKDINNPENLNGIAMQGAKRVDDLKRITKLLTQTPAALKFAANLTALNKIQNDIQSPDKTFVGNLLRGARDSAKIIASTLAQVPVSGTGTHFVTGFAGKKGYLEGVRGHIAYRNRVEGELYEGGTGNIPTVGKIEITGEADDVNKRGKVLSTYVDKFTQTLGTPFVPQTTTVVVTGSNSIQSPEQRNKITKGSEYKLLYVPLTRSTTTTFDRVEQGFEAEIPIITSPDSTIGKPVTDVFTGLRMITGSLSDSQGAFTPTDDFGAPLIDTKDLIDFNFKVIEPIRIDGGSPTVTYIPFRAYLDSFNDSYTGEWNTFKYIGRAENFYTYGGFDRTIQFGFKVAASSKAEMLPLYEKLNQLVSSTAPSYVGTGFMRGQFVAVTIGDYLKNQTGFISSITFDWNTDYIWHSEGMDDFGKTEELQEGEKSTTSKQLPTILDVRVSFTPIHTSLPKYGAEFIGKNNEIFKTN